MATIVVSQFLKLCANGGIIIIMIYAQTKNDKNEFLGLYLQQVLYSSRMVLKAILSFLFYSPEAKSKINKLFYCFLQK